MLGKSNDIIQHNNYPYASVFFIYIYIFWTIGVLEFWSLGTMACHPVSLFLVFMLSQSVQLLYTDFSIESSMMWDVVSLSCRTKTETGRRPSEVNNEDTNHADEMLVTLTALSVIVLQLEDLSDLWCISKTFEGLFLALPGLFKELNQAFLIFFLLFISLFKNFLLFRVFWNTSEKFNSTF